MISIQHINRTDSIEPQQKLTPARPGFDGFLSVSMTDDLLKETMQYEKWKMIRQNDPERAADIARIVLERHDYVTGKTPATEEGRKHFNLLTDRLKNDGIYLYNSYQFRNPIFDEPAACNISATTAESKRSDIFLPISVSNSPGLMRRFSGMDCYEFLAGVLEENGISYYGSSGVGSALIDQARSRGMNLNAFLTGEGITRLLCDNPFEIKVSGAADASFKEIWDKIETHLKKGAILSFSSSNTGHTGIIDNEDGRWVFINSSGVPGNRNSYRLIKEDLKEEIQNRLRGANRQQTFLNITLGSVSRALTSRFENPLLFEGKGNSPLRAELVHLAVG